ncbi:DUF3383 family protein [Salibacterium halotolerans]|uniref:DUF3383 family protein n=1 Tax=Salibacterium halotolerans TaxID=1884432 RepID=A0A1I5NBG5_9BACI|nr:DUF3383 family protein [Salibacterium halotolerans]SFP18706.1 Protein of unknown function [Salibacterium halotolerans]
MPRAPLSDVDIDIGRESISVSRAGYSKQLILGTSKDSDYREYFGIGQVEEDYAQGSPEHAKAKAIFDQNEHNDSVAIHSIAYDPDASTDPDTPTKLTTELDELIKEHADWYFLHSTAQRNEDIDALSNWTDGKLAMFITTSDDVDFVNGFHDTRSTMRTSLYYHPTDLQFAERMTGRWGVEDPGTITWKFKGVTGSSVVNLSPAEIKELHSNYVNTYIKKQGKEQTSEGFVVNGDFIDSVHGQDFIEMRMSEETQTMLQNRNKVPYSSGGIALVVGIVKKVLQEAFDQGIILENEGGNPSFTITAPSITDASPEDRAARKLPPVLFNYQREGAVHTATITGRVAV